MKLKIYAVILTFIFSASNLSAQRTSTWQLSNDLLQKSWKAQWITGPGKPINRFNASSDQTLKEYGIYKFRKRSSCPSNLLHS